VLKIELPARNSAVLRTLHKVATNTGYMRRAGTSPPSGLRQIAFSRPGSAFATLMSSFVELTF